MRCNLLPSVILAILLTILRPGAAEALDEFVEQVANGNINWTLGVVQTTGTGVSPEWALGTPQERPLALTAARTAAQRHLLEVIQGIRIQSKTNVSHIMASDDSITAHLERMVKDTQLKSKKYMTDGTVEVTIEMSLNGGFAQLILPHDIKQVEPIKTSTSGPGSNPGKTSGSDRYTGLIVDTRGLDARPAMNPKIFDEDGVEVYGSAFVSREYAVQQGMSGYSKNIDTAISNQRVADHPLIVKGLKTDPLSLSDIVISNADAAKLRSTSQNLSLLKQCRVMIVMDGQ